MLGKDANYHFLSKNKLPINGNVVGPVLVGKCMTVLAAVLLNLPVRSIIFLCLHTL
jgi:hypothetical protein